MLSYIRVCVFISDPFQGHNIKINQFFYCLYINKKEKKIYVGSGTNSKFLLKMIGISYWFGFFNAKAIRLEER